MSVIKSLTEGHLVISEMDTPAVYYTEAEVKELSYNDQWIVLMIKRRERS